MSERIKIIFLLLVILTSCRCITTEENIFKKNINDCDISDLGISHIIGWSYNMFDLNKVRFNNLEYYVGVNENEDIHFVLTWDKEFITPDNVKLGDTFKSIKEQCIFKSYYTDNFVYILNSGWTVILKFDGYKEQKFPDDSSRVVWFERYVERE